MKLFKYCDIDTATAILKDCRIRLNSASNFNDPYDSLGYKEIGGIVAGREIFNEVYSQLPANIAGAYYLTDVELNQAYSNVKYISSSFLNLITCFSSCNDSILMWSHYAVKHCGARRAGGARGFCLGARCSRSEVGRSKAWAILKGLAGKPRVNPLEIPLVSA